MLRRTAVHRATICMSAVCLLLGCAESSERFVGEWELWSVDGVALAEVAPEVFEMPAMSLGEATVAQGEIKTETTTLFRAITVFADGEFHDETVSQATWVVAPSAVRAMGGMAFGSDAIRETQPVDTSETIGAWRIEGDSLRLSVDPSQAKQLLLETLKDMSPKTEEDLNAVLDSSFAGTSLDERLVVARVGDRLIGRGLEGRILAFRKRTR